MAHFSLPGQVGAGVIAILILLGAGPLARYLAIPQFPPHCQVGQWPAFTYGFAALRLDLGDTMGEPVECEHAIDAAGDTEQLTTTGLAHYDHASNTPAFHRGTDNWALTARGLVFWRGAAESSVPADAVAIPSPGAARLAHMAEINSRPTAPTQGPAFGVDATVPAPTPEPEAIPASAEDSNPLTEAQIGPVAAFLGISNQRARDMTVGDVVRLTQGSDKSMGDAARVLGSASAEH